LRAARRRKVGGIPMCTLIILFIDPDEIDGDRAPRVYRFRKVPPTSRLSKEAWQRACARDRSILAAKNARRSSRARARVANFLRHSADLNPDRRRLALILASLPPPPPPSSDLRNLIYGLNGLNGARGPHAPRFPAAPCADKSPGVEIRVCSICFARNIHRGGRRND